MSAHVRAGLSALLATILRALLWAGGGAIDGDRVREEYSGVTDEAIGYCVEYAARLVERHSERVSDVTVRRCAERGCDWCGTQAEQGGV